MDDETEVTEPNEPVQEVSYIGRGFAFLAGIVAVVGVLVYRVYPSGRHPLGAKHTFIDLIFNNNLVVFAA